ncbi:hypothetical protein UFOVP247_116 [uncultured Caudovirales phage]|uniref:Uncharacterized protein n=1 Tax=uncultured Caudovirales phage TaxID=2100421 RepID=A0A6J7WTZ7_9CAUD|nr:hypothetical protein UFOVP247_116 [uncultured Caudovirales phage]
MTADEINIREIYSALNRDWKKKYSYENYLFNLHSKAENTYKHMEFFDRIQKNFDHLDRITIMASSDPVALCYLIKKYYGSEITIVSDHPILERIGEFFIDDYGVDVVFKNPMFEDATEQVKDADLVIFPEYEYFVPLDMIKYYDINKNTAVLHYVSRVNKQNTTEPILSEQDLLDQCSFKEVIDVGKFKTAGTNRNVYYAMGVK